MQAQPIETNSANRGDKPVETNSETQPEDQTVSSLSDAAQPATENDPQRVAGLLPRAFWVAKAGNAASDYEDAWAVGPNCLAIADGATESSFARLWASGLVEGFVTRPAAIFPLPPGGMDECRARLMEWTAPLQKTWHAGVPWNSLPWFAEDKARSGAFATLLGFTLLETGLQPDAPATAGIAADSVHAPATERPLADSSQNIHRASTQSEGQASTRSEGQPGRTQPSTFQVFAIGDSCLFQIRDGQLKTAFPLTHSSQFDSRPLLLSSNMANNKRVWSEILTAEGTLQPGDILLFATDALARWFLVECESNAMPWHALCSLTTQEEFEAFVARLRHERVMRNDDVTLVIVDGTQQEPLSTEASAANGITLAETIHSPQSTIPSKNANAAHGITRAETANDLTQPESPAPQALFAGTAEGSGERAESELPNRLVPNLLSDDANETGRETAS